MNDAHLHMVVNHFPIIGTLFGLGILFVGFLKKNNSIQQTGLVVLIIAALFAFLAMNTGEGAEEIVEDLGISHQIIHEHEELAEKFIWVSNFMGLAALLSLWMLFKNNKKSKMMVIITLILALSCAIFGKFVGTSGGEIRHTEIRENPTNVEASQLDEEH